MGSMHTNTIQYTIFKGIIAQGFARISITFNTYPTHEFIKILIIFNIIQFIFII